MADAARFPATQVGERLRSIVTERRERLRRTRFCAIVALATMPVMATAVCRMPMLLVWNASASAPIGLYWVDRHAQIRSGDMVVGWAPQAARALAAARNYIPADVPLVKRVAAVEGNRVCAEGALVSIDNRRVASRLHHDFAGRPIPWWNGCRTLGRSEYFLLMDEPRSFDGRYFGITSGSDLVGRGVLLWAEPAHRTNDA